MTTAVSHDQHHHEDPSAKVIFGFWLFVLSDSILFCALFITYVLLHGNTFGNIGIQQIASLPYVLAQTLILLASSLTYGLSFAAFARRKKIQVILWLILTFILGLLFALMQFHEFSYLIQHGATWQKSAFLSAFFGLTGIYWFHAIAGLLWMLVLILQFSQRGITTIMGIRITCLGMFWNFLIILWTCIFVIVFLMGAL